jgi:hypothetical protein
MTNLAQQRISTQASVSLFNLAHQLIDILDEISKIRRADEIGLSTGHGINLDTIDFSDIINDASQFSDATQLREFMDYCYEMLYKNSPEKLLKMIK